MTNYKALTIVFATLTILFVASTGFLASTTMNSSTHTIVQTTTSTVTVENSSAQSTTSSGSQGGESIGIADNPTLNHYLTNGTGWTLYLFTKDTPYNGTSSCYGQCQTFWPPLYGSASGLSLSPGLNASSFGTIIRADGTKQITYEGWPLYYYAGDKAAGQTNGQDKDGTWFVVNFPKISIPSSATTQTAQTTTQATQTIQTQTTQTTTQTTTRYSYPY
jgi:predicted lipoprotein with Yx(FWY)xxD motif